MDVTSECRAYGMPALAMQDQRCPVSMDTFFVMDRTFFFCTLFRCTQVPIADRLFRLFGSASFETFRMHEAIPWDQIARPSSQGAQNGHQGRPEEASFYRDRLPSLRLWTPSIQATPWPVIQLISPNESRRLHSYMASRPRARVALRSPSPLGSIAAASSPGFPAPFAALPAPGRARLLLNPAISRVEFFLGERVF